MKKVLTFLSALVISTLLFAQAPQGISYQAIAFNTGGNPVVSSTVGVKISIISGSPSGTVEYTETHSPTTNAQGLFNLNIGTGIVVTGTFSEIDWANTPYFLKIEVDPAGGTNYTIVGISELMSVPYALYAQTAETVQSVNAANIIGSVEPDSGGIGVLTSSTVYAYNNGQWYQQSINGTAQKIIGTGEYVIGAMTTSTLYAFNGSQWYQQSINGTSQKILGSSGNIGAVSTSTAYGFSGTQWHQQSFNGSLIDITAAQGVFGVATTSTGYAFSNGQWYQQSLNGTFQRMKARRGKILIYTTSTAYSFDSSLNQWHQQALNGSPLDYAH